MKNKKIIFGLAILALLSSCGGHKNNPSSNSSNNTYVDDGKYTLTEGTDGIFYELNEEGNGYIVKECQTIDPDIVIPELYEGLPVREIASDAFRYFTLDSIVLPRSLRVIHERAFLGLTSDSGITNLVLPDGIEEIKDEAFKWCVTLKEVTLPKTLKKFGNNVFTICTNLKKIHMEDNNYFKVDSNVLYTKDMRELLCYPCALTSSTFDMPNSVERIAESAMYANKGLTSIALSSSLKVIERRGLAALSNLASLSFKKTQIETIGELALSENSSLLTVTIPSTVKNLGEKVFYNDSSLVSVIFENDFEVLPKETFDSCSKLTSVTLPKSLTTIGEAAFNSCNSLARITLPSTVQEIHNRAFYATSSLRLISLPNNLKTLGEYVFAYNRSLQNVTFPDALEEIGKGAFISCDLFTQIDLSNTKVHTIGETAFMNCQNVIEVKFPNTLKTIEDSAFKSILYLEKVNLPDGIEIIGDSAFYGWRYLKSVYIPSSIKSIGTIAFTSIQQERADLTLYFEADSYTATTNFTNGKTEFGVTRAEYEAL